MDRLPVLIVEHSTQGLAPIFEDNKIKQYFLSGIFTEFDIENRNQRIYTAEKFIPHMNELLERKKQLGVIYGEFDHPDVFDTSLARVSHTVEKLVFNKANNRIEGEIRLLSTKWGKEAKALVDDGCPIFVSSRAAGITESNNTVTIKKLFTYDAVADPGFSNARMELKSLNESFGFNESSNFRIYNISDESKINELFNMNGNDKQTEQDLINMNEWLKSEVELLKTQIAELTSNSKYEPEKLTQLIEYQEKLQEQQEQVTKYLDVFAEKFNILVKENNKLKEQQEKLVKHNDYLAETLDKAIGYSESIGESVNQAISYAEYIGETLDKSIDFQEYIAENVNNTIEYTDYLSENLQKGINYSEYIAETLDRNIQYGEYLAENLDKSIEYQEYIAENLDKSIQYGEYLAESIDKSIEYSEYLAEHVDNSIAYSEYLAENVADGQAYMNYIAEALDTALEFNKAYTLNEEYGEAPRPQMPDFKVNSVERYYDEDEDETTEEEPIEGEPVGQPEGEPVGQPEGEPLGQPQAQAQPVAGAQPEAQPMAGAQAQPMAGAEAQPVQPIGLAEPSVQGEPMGTQQELVPGLPVAVGAGTGEVKAYNPNNGFVVIQMQGQEEPIEIHESKVTILSDNIVTNEDELTKSINSLILEAKNRRAAKEEQPHFMNFLTEKNKIAFSNLTTEDKEKVKIALKESSYYTEADVLRIINEALTEKVVTFEDMLVENIPTELKDTWASLNENAKIGLISAARLHGGNLNTPAKMKAFWESRKLENYTINESKKLLNETKVIDSDKLSDSQLESMLEKLRNL